MSTEATANLEQRAINMKQLIIQGDNMFQETFIQILLKVSGLK